MADSSSYEQVLARNVIAARARLHLSQKDLAARMKALGYSWYPQTVGTTERGERRLVAEEILGLALALETSIGRLMDPTQDDQAVRLPSAQVIPVGSVLRSVRHFNDGAVVWTGNTPDIASTWPLPEREGIPEPLPDDDVMGPIGEFTPEMMRARNERIARARGGYREVEPPPRRDQRKRADDWMPGDQ